MRRILLLTAAVTAAGCGGSGGQQLKAVEQQGPIGSGPKEVWFYPSKGKPRSLVIFLHGYGGPTAETPEKPVPSLHALSEMISAKYR